MIYKRCNTPKQYQVKKRYKKYPPENQNRTPLS